MIGPFEAVIGLEVHVQLATAEKLFSAVPAAFGGEPNTHIDPVILGLPGALPVLNGEAVDLAIRAAFGFGCEVHPVSIFARKNYFYPDLPKGYQISQFDRPLATGGRVTLDPGPDDEGAAEVIRVRRLHLEEDAGKSLHDRFEDGTAVDLNRAGVPLAEIVSEPDLRSPAAARAYLDELKRILEYLEVSDCNMEEGSLRVDANISIRPVGEEGLGTKTELKNMNSFSGVERALEVEIARQISVVEGGGQVAHETLLWDPQSGGVRVMRSKEESHDYRYFPDPDLPPLQVDPGRIARIRAALPELPRARRLRFVEQYGLPVYDAGVLTARRGMADYFERVVEAGALPKSASNWIMGPLLELGNEGGKVIEALGLAPESLVEIVQLVEDGTIAHGTGKGLIPRVLTDGRNATDIVKEEGLAQVGDATALLGWIEEVLSSNHDEVARLKAGDSKLIGFFVGQVMRVSKGTADPREVSRLLRESLEAG